MRRGKIIRYLANVSNWMLEQVLAEITKWQNLLTGKSIGKCGEPELRTHFSSRECHFDFSTKGLQSGFRLLKSKGYWTLSAIRPPMLLNRFCSPKMVPIRESCRRNRGQESHQIKWFFITGINITIRNISVLPTYKTVSIHLRWWRNISHKHLTKRENNPSSIRPWMFELI